MPELPPGLWGVKARAATPFGKPRLFWQPTLGTAPRTLAACSARAAAQTWAARSARAVARTRNHHAVIHVCLDCVRVCLVWRHPRVRRRGSWFPQPRPRCSRASQHIQHKGHCRCALCWNRSDMVAIMDMAQWHGLCVIEDADQALLSKHGDRHLGSICHHACMSFHYTKNTVCGVSGVLLIKLPDLAYRARILREIGTNSSDFMDKKVSKYECVDLGSSYEPSEPSAAFLYAQLGHAADCSALRWRVCRAYAYAYCSRSRPQACCSCPSGARRL